MNKSIMLRRLLLAPPAIRRSFLPLPLIARTVHPQLNRRYAVASVTQTSFWLGLIPKPLRKSSPTAALKNKVKSKEWNPATFFIVIFLLIGSMSIQMIALRNESSAFIRRADAKIGLLREIIGRIQNGEEVDVEGLLGTGDKQREKEWEEVLQEIEREDQAWEESKRSKPKHGRNLEEANATKASSKASREVDSSLKIKPRTNAPSGFY